MKIEDMTLAQWQVRLDEFRRENAKAVPLPAFRIDNTSFSTAKYYGAFTFNGKLYKVFYFDDGAMLGVRDDMLKWLRRKLMNEAKEAAK